MLSILHSWLSFSPPGRFTDMFATTVVQYVVGSLIGLLFACIAVWLIVALFSDRQLSRFHWGKGRGRPPMSRVSILLALPLFLYIPARYIVYAIGIEAGHEGTWALPNWWLFPCAGMILLGRLYDAITE